jgi:aminotransferase
MFTRQELEALSRVAEEADLLVITDEIYEYIRYDGREHVPPATVGSLASRTVTIMGLSKTFSITGWRLGYAVAPEAMAQGITLVHDLYYICAPTPLQYGVAAGFEAPKEFFAAMQADYATKRSMTCEALTAANLEPIVPQGAYYVLADVSRLGHSTSRDASWRCWKRRASRPIPGSAFWQTSDGRALRALLLTRRKRRCWPRRAGDLALFRG